MSKNFLEKLYRKIIFNFHLQDFFPIDEFLTTKESRLFNIEKFRDIDGWFTDKEGIALFRIASKLPVNSNIVEIGSWKGKSTFALACGIPKRSKITCIDPFDATAPTDKASERTLQKMKGKGSVYNQFISNMKKLRVFNHLKILKGYSNQFVGSITKIDLLFIDADHTIKGCDFDFLNYSPYLRKGGYIAFHDYVAANPKQGPTRVVEKRVKNSSDYQFVGLYDSLWISRKT